MQRRQSPICVICGVNPTETVEHIPAKAFFKGSSLDQLLTVPACFKCNNGTSDIDEEFRNYVSAQVGMPNPAAQSLWELGAQKSLKRNTRFREKLIRNSSEVTLRNADNTTQVRIAFSVETKLYEKIFNKITRGLYFIETGKILNPNTPIKSTPHTEKSDLSNGVFSILSHRSVMDGAFEYRFALLPEDNECGLWLYSFHDTVWVESLTGKLCNE